MAFVDAKCPNCGGTLKVDRSSSIAACPFCDSVILVRDAISNFYTTNNVIANSVNLVGRGDAEKERLLKNAATRERYGETNVALRIYSQVAEDYPDDYRGWYGIARLRSKGFTETPTKKEYEDIAENMRKVLIAAGPADKGRLQAEWDGYKQSYSDFLISKTHELSNMQNTRKWLENERKRVTGLLEEHGKTMNSFTRSHSERNSKAKLPKVFFFALAAGLICLLNHSRSQKVLIAGLLLIGLFAMAAVITVLVNSSRKAAVSRYEVMLGERERLQSELDHIKAKLDSADDEIARIRYAYGL